MNSITKDLLRDLRVDIDAALVAVGAKHGVKLLAGNASFLASNATFKLNVSLLDETGEAVSKEAADLKRYREMLGLTFDQLTQVFTLGMHRYTLAGYRNRGSTRPFLMRRIDNDKIYLGTREDIDRAFGINRASLIGGAA